jgi:RNA polymerase-binding transcription factor DksA
MGKTEQRTLEQRTASDRDYAMGDRNSQRLREAGSALRLIGDGTFGIRAGCEGTKNPKPLAAIPWTSFWIVCQETAEHHRQPRISQ